MNNQMSCKVIAILDGEIYSHEVASKTVSAAMLAPLKSKREPTQRFLESRNKTLAQVTLFIFDVVAPELKFVERLEILNELSKDIAKQ